MPRALNEPELKIWNEIRAHRLIGVGFRRQAIAAGLVEAGAALREQQVSRREIDP